MAPIFNVPFVEILPLLSPTENPLSPTIPPYAVNEPSIVTLEFNSVWPLHVNVPPINTVFRKSVSSCTVKSSRACMLPIHTNGANRDIVWYTSRLDLIEHGPSHIKAWGLWLVLVICIPFSEINLPFIVASPPIFNVPFVEILPFVSPTENPLSPTIPPYVVNKPSIVTLESISTLPFTVNVPFAVIFWDNKLPEPILRCLFPVFHESVEFSYKNDAVELSPNSISKPASTAVSAFNFILLLFNSTVVEFTVVCVPCISKSPFIVTFPVSSPIAAGSITNVAGPCICPVVNTKLPVVSSISELAFTKPSTVNVESKSEWTREVNIPSLQSIPPVAVNKPVIFWVPVTFNKVSTFTLVPVNEPTSLIVLLPKSETTSFS